MSRSRLSHALSTGALALPDGPILVLGAPAGFDLSAIDRDRVTLVSRFSPDADHWQRSGRHVVQTADGEYTAALVVLPRAKDAARALLAEAARRAPLLLVDGQKTDGADSILKSLKAIAPVDNVLSRAHGKLFWLASPELDDWTGTPRDIGGFVTRPGVFSADGPDAGSMALADALPELGGHVVDLGAGWGFLSRGILASDRVTKLDLVEADLTALDCARDNIDDPRAQFHWADATTFAGPALVDVVVTNPPFHTGRKGDPDLGRAFIAAAHRLLKPTGTLWVVANRHLPYETALSTSFGESAEIGGTAGFKVLRAAKPLRPRRSAP